MNTIFWPAKSPANPYGHFTADIDQLNTDCIYIVIKVYYFL